MTHYLRKKIKAASERGKRMAAKRWQLDRECRNKLAALTAEQFPSRILKRIVVIENESTVREATIWSFDSRRSARSKLSAALYGNHQQN